MVSPLWRQGTGSVAHGRRAALPAELPRPREGLQGQALGQWRRRHRPWQASRGARADTCGRLSAPGPGRVHAGPSPLRIPRQGSLTTA